jgi:hypothetical protein
MNKKLPTEEERKQITKETADKWYYDKDSKKIKKVKNGKIPDNK